MHAIESVFSLLAADPMVLMEAAALLLTVVYLARLAGATQLLVGGGGPALHTACARARRAPSLEERLLSLFEVGGMIPLPKQSLRNQRAKR